jgi:hypothetical protein
MIKNKTAFGDEYFLDNAIFRNQTEYNHKGLFPVSN